MVQGIHLYEFVQIKDASGGSTETTSPTQQFSRFVHGMGQPHTHEVAGFGSCWYAILIHTGCNDDQ